jgi:hypothetical protein
MTFDPMTTTNPTISIPPLTNSDGWSTTGVYPPVFEVPCQCGYEGMHTWAGHWFRLLWTRRTW